MIAWPHKIAANSRVERPLELDPSIDAQEGRWETLPMRAWWRRGAIALLVLTATGFPLRAEADPEHVRVQFSAPRGCPDATAFLRALRQRTGRFRLGGGTERTRLFVATITQTKSSVDGRLEIRGPGSEVSTRSVPGKTCNEVMSALALMTALAIDPNAVAPPGPSLIASAPSPPPNLSVKPPSSKPLSPPPPAQPDADEARSVALPAPQSGLVGLARTPPSAPVSASWKWSVGLQGHTSLHVSPTPGLGGSLFVEAAAPGGSLLGPVLRVGLFVNHSEVSLASGAGADLLWTAAMVEGCPIRFERADARFAFYPCLAFHLGVLRGRGSGLDQPRQAVDTWSDVGPVARIRFATSTHLFLEALGMLVFPIRRLTFDVQDYPAQAPTSAYTAPVIGVLAGMGAGYAFR